MAATVSCSMLPTFFAPAQRLIRRGGLETVMLSLHRTGVTNFSDNAESVRIELTWVLPQPWFSIPVPYHFGQPSRLRRERDSNSWSFTPGLFSRQLLRPARLSPFVWVIRFELIHPPGACFTDKSNSPALAHSLIIQATIFLIYWLAWLHFSVESA